MKKDKNSKSEAMRMNRRELMRLTGAATIGLMGVEMSGAEPQQRGAIGETGLRGGERGIYPGQTPATAHVSQGKKLRDLLARKGVVLPVLGVPDAAGAVKMEAAGAECAFIGTSLYFGRLGSVPDLGLVSYTESLWVAK